MNLKFLLLPKDQYLQILLSSPNRDFQEVSAPLAADVLGALIPNSFKLDLIAFFSKTRSIQIFNFRQYYFLRHPVVLANNRYDRDVE